MLTDVELAGMRATAAEVLVEQVQVVRATRVSDGLGGKTETWVTIATVPGHLSPEIVPPIEPILGDRPSIVERWAITVPPFTDVTAQDRLVIGARTFEVRGTNQNRTWGLTLVCHCSEIL